MKKIEKLDELVPGNVVIEVEAYGDGNFFSVCTPLMIIEGPTDAQHSARAERLGEVGRSKWSPMASRWYVVVREHGGDPREKFALSLPTKDGVTIAREPGDYTGLYAYTPEVEDEFRQMGSLAEYRAATE